MKYNFDEIIPRENTNSISYDGWRDFIAASANGEKVTLSDDDYLRFWVADMDFATPPEVLQAMHARLDKRILGYSRILDPNYFAVLTSWFARRYGVEIDSNEVVLSPGVVPALNRLVPLLTTADEGVLICTPSYTPFKQAGEYSQRTVYTSKLLNDNGTYTMDFADLEQQLADRAKNINLFILCNPHNPSGRVWSQDELQQLGALCERHDVWIISDEIHCDILRQGMTHTPLVSCFPNNRKIITCTAPSKTFNLAGNLISHIFIRDQAIREQWIALYDDCLSPLSLSGTQAAYSQCDDWLEQLKTYLDANFALLEQFLKNQLPKAQFVIPQATYLAWVDFSYYLNQFDDGDNPTLFFAKHAQVILEGGEKFVGNGEGHVRINVACPRAVLQQGLAQIAAALNS